MTAKTDELSLRAIAWNRFLHAPDGQLLEDLYVPGLSRAVRYDRCCAYFSSQVLAVAARGFGRLIERINESPEMFPTPAVRLLVNEQLDQSDRKALLATGDQSGLIEKLIRQFKTPKDALEKNRLEMLCWLVASGLLEVRVGLMRYTEGILHAKFGVFSDASGDSIAFMGSGNETGSALLENYEELEVRASWQDGEFTDNYQARFEQLWQGKDEHVLTLPLPAAVQAKLIQFAPTSRPFELPADRAALEAAMLWRYIAVAGYLPNGDKACDATALVDVWPHQRRVVEDAARAFPSGRLLCDEVGMGKTIEAILVLRRLFAGRGVRRALLLVPAALLKQWQDELREKGGLVVPRLENGYLYLPDSTRSQVDPQVALASNDIMLLSREWARLEQNRALLLSAPAWDLVLLDEAHAARRRAPEEGEFNSGNLLLQLLRELQLRRQTRGILLMSATPMQTQPWEPWDLLAVLGEGGEWLVEFNDIRMYYEGLAQLKKGALHDANAGTVARLVTRDEFFPALNGGSRSSDAEELRDRLTFAYGDEATQYAEWLRRGAPLVRRMHRNTRNTLREYYRKGLLAMPPAQRQVDDVVFDYREQAERDCYEAVTGFIDKRFEQLEREKRGKGFVMTIYRRRAASSPRALRRSLERRLAHLEQVIGQRWTDNGLSPLEEDIDPSELSDDGEIDRIDLGLPKAMKSAQEEKREVRSLLERLDKLGATDSKFDRFWELLKQVTADGRSVLVFTEYVDTLTYLRDQLRGPYDVTLGCYSGDGGQIWDGECWTSVSKAEITDRLDDGRLKVVICTDAASEGLNLQAASALINYDLPWNPSKVEQRIGRIDRIGQKQPELPIRNLFLNDSVDMKVYQALRMRCGLFEHFVGPMQPVLALARDALRGDLGREMVTDLLKQLAQKAEQVEKDEVVGSAYFEEDAQLVLTDVTPVTRQDLELALSVLEAGKTAVRARRAKEVSVWRVSLPGRPVMYVSTDREALERDPSVWPITAGGDVVQHIAAHLSLPMTRVPLVLVEHAAGSFRCAEVRWVGGQGTIAVQSVGQLRGLLQSWDGRGISASDRLKAEAEAMRAVQGCVEKMREAALAVVEIGLQKQLASASLRLRRELARTLRCIGSGDLTAILREQLSKETSSDGRYHRALELLGGYPIWTAEERQAAAAYADVLGPKDRQARVALASEVEAAVNDPRWRAQIIREG